MRIYRRLAAVVAAAALSAVPAPAQLTISQVYGGGGSGAAGTAYQRDYIELYNRGTTGVSLSGLSLQYASAAGAFNNVFALDATVTIAPGGRYTVVTGTAGTAGVANPGYANPQDGSTAGTLNLSATAGKVALASTTTTLGTLTGDTTGVPNVLDLVGYGSTASAYEGAGPAPTFGSNANSLYRAGTPYGSQDLNNNASDFVAAAAVQFVPVPEPATIGLLAAGSLGLVRLVRRRLVG